MLDKDENREALKDAIDLAKVAAQAGHDKPHIVLRDVYKQIVSILSKIDNVTDKDDTQ